MLTGECTIEDGNEGHLLKTFSLHHIGNNKWIELYWVELNILYSINQSIIQNSSSIKDTVAREKINLRKMILTNNVQSSAANSFSKIRDSPACVRSHIFFGDVFDQQNWLITFPHNGIFHRRLDGLTIAQPNNLWNRYCFNMNFQPVKEIYPSIQYVVHCSKFAHWTLTFKSCILWQPLGVRGGRGWRN